MSRRPVIVVGASLGGVEALMTLAATLPADLPAAVCIALHTSDHPNALPQILERRGPLPALTATDGAVIRPGCLYIAPAGHHLLVSRAHLHVVQGPKEHGFRPAIDPLFRSAARAYGPGAIGVILTGMLDDGTAGLRAIVEQGGTAVVQDPDEAIAPSMPRSALTYVAVDYIVSLDTLGDLLGRLAREYVGERDDDMPLNEDDDGILGDADGPLDIVGHEEGTPLPFSCPECGGVLSEVYEGTLLRFRCQTGHRYSLQSVEAQQIGATDRALAGALTAVNERTLLLHRLMQEARERHDHSAERRFAARAQVAAEQEKQLHRMLDGLIDALGDTRAV